jgi:hypothetical protein
MDGRKEGRGHGILESGDPQIVYRGPPRESVNPSNDDCIDRSALQYSGGTVTS